MAPFYCGKLRKYQALMTTAGRAVVIDTIGRDEKGPYATTIGGSELRFVSRVGWYVKTTSDEALTKTWIKGVLK